MLIVFRATQNISVNSIILKRLLPVKWCEKIMQVLFEKKNFLERYFTKHQKFASVAKLYERNVTRTGPPAGFEQENIVSPNGLLLTVFS